MMSNVDVIIFAPGREPEILKTEDSIEAWEKLVGGPLGSYNSGMRDFGFMCLDSFKDTDPPNRIRVGDNYLIRGPFIIYRTHQGQTVDATELDLARAKQAFRPFIKDQPHQTLEQLLKLKAGETERHGFATLTASDLQELLEKITRPFESTPADLTHARAAAAAVGLSATIDRYKGLIIFRRLCDVAEPTDFIRISGMIECQICHYIASDHPPAVSAPFLTVLCDGRHVKL
jgi:hypothetical protein